MKDSFLEAVKALQKYFKNNPDYLYFPSEDTLESITNLLFSTEEKTV